MKNNERNFEGKRNLDNVKLRYTREILKLFQEKPEIVDTVLECTDVTKDEMKKILSNEKKANISFYDDCLRFSKYLVEHDENLEEFIESKKHIH